MYKNKVYILDLKYHVEIIGSKITLASIKMARDFGTQLRGLYSFNHGIFCKKSKVYLICDLAKKNFQGRTKIDEDIDKFDEDVLTMNRPSSAMAHLIFDR